MILKLDDVLEDAGPFMILTVDKYKCMEKELESCEEQLMDMHRSYDSVAKQIKLLEGRLNDV